MSSSWILWTFAMLFFWLLQTVTMERQNATTDDADDADHIYEYEDKILREYFKRFINIYNKNIQPSTELTNIQRISKKSRTSTSTIPTIKHENIEPLPTYPVLFSPYYQQNIYSSYIPLSYSTTNHPIPISQISYPQDEYYHRLLVPLHSQSNTHIPSIISSSPINNDLKLKFPINTQTYISQNNLNETFINTMKKSLNQNKEESDHTLPIILVHDESVKNINKNDENPIRNKKLLDSLDNTSNLMTTEAIQLNNSQEVQQSLSTTGKLDTFTLPEIINFPETNNITSTPMSITITDTTNMYSSPVSQIILDTNYRFSNEINTKSPYTFSVTGQPKTITEKESLTTNKNIFNETKLFLKENKESDEPKKIHHHLSSLNNIAITTESTNIMKTSINNKKYSTVLIKTTQTPVTLLTLSSLVDTSSNDTTISTDSYDSSIQMRSAYTTSQPININNMYDNKSHLISSLPPSTTISKAILSYKTLQSSTFKTPILQDLPKEINSNISTNSYLTKEPFINKTIASTINKNNISLLSSLQSLNNTKTTTSMLIETKTELTPSTTKNLHNYKTNIKQNPIIPNYYSESPKLSSTNTISTLSQKLNIPEPLLGITQNNLPSNILFKPNLNHTITNEHTDYNFSISTKETRKNSLESITVPTKLNNPNEKNYSTVTPPNDLKYNKSTNKQIKYTEKSMQIPQTIKESELWYSSINKQNIPKKELNEEQINFLLTKLIKLLKPEIEKQTITQDSMARFVAPKLGDQEKFVYIILPWIRNAAKNMENEERIERKSYPKKTSNKI